MMHDTDYRGFDIKRLATSWSTDPHFRSLAPSVINERNLAAYLELTEIRRPDGLLECSPQESLVDWLARTYGISVATFQPDLESWRLQEEGMDDFLEKLAMLSPSSLVLNPRPPVFYVNDIASQFFGSGAPTYEEQFGALLDLPIKPPYPDMLVFHDRLSVTRLEQAMECLTHVIELENRLVLTTYVILRWGTPPYLPMIAGITTIAVDPETFIMGDALSPTDSRLDEAIGLVPCVWHTDSMRSLPELERIDRSVSILQSAVSPTIYTLLLLNCRNVDWEEEEVHRSRQERRARERKGMGDNKSYRVRVKVPGHKRVIYYGGRNAKPAESDLALHMVRGHFRRYTEARPLFGKHVGTYWIPAFLRGDRVTGRIREGYEGVLDEQELAGIG